MQNPDEQPAYLHVGNMATINMHHRFEPPGEITALIQNAVDSQRGPNLPVSLIHKIYAALRQSSGFKELVESASSFSPSEQAPVFKATLLGDHQYRLAMIGIHRFAPISVHDHPCAISAQLILRGRVLVRNYRVSEIVREPSLVRLDCIAEQILGKGSTASIENGANNLHGLQSMNLNAVLLSLQIPPVEKDQQGWYFPTRPFGASDPRAIWNRIVKSRGGVGAESPLVHLQAEDVVA
jgi:hypothetical protein